MPFAFAQKACELTLLCLIGLHIDVLTTTFVCTFPRFF